jgi:hypothetical protein
MKKVSVQFKLSERVYKKAKAQLEKSGLSWQKIGEKFTEHLVLSEALGEWGLPLHEMSPSVRQRVTGEVEGHVETALWKYIQIQHEGDGRNRNHWMAALRAALKQLIKSNSVRVFKRGYVFTEQELQEILNKIWPDALWLAAGHLGIETKQIKISKPSLGELFKFADVPFALTKTR